MRRVIEVPTCPASDTQSQMAYLGLFTFTELEALMNGFTPGDTVGNAALVNEKVAQWGTAESACRCMELMMLAASLRDTLQMLTGAMRLAYDDELDGPVDISVPRTERLRTYLGID